jgi:hypothetical protein
MEILAHGGISLDDQEQRQDMLGPEALLHGGEHHDDTSKVYRQNFVRNGSNLTGASSYLPRDRIVTMIERNGFVRPTPKSWTTVEQV